MADAPPAGARVSYRQQFRRCGKPGCPTCRPGQPGHGPYWYATWWADGRTHSQYLGRQAPAGIASVEQPAPAPETPARSPAAEMPVWSLPEVAADQLRVRTLGAFEVWRGETLIPPREWARRK